MSAIATPHLPLGPKFRLAAPGKVMRVDVMRVLFLQRVLSVDGTFIQSFYIFTKMIIRHAATTVLRASSHAPMHRHLLKCRTPVFSSVISRPSLPQPRQQPVRTFASTRTADTVMDSLQEMYATAKDEFEIAVEETEKKTVYASDDRAAAKVALQLLKDEYQKAVRESSPDVAQEVTNRVGQRIRELENAVTALEESATED
jgi:hypothetical protein